MKNYASVVLLFLFTAQVHAAPDETPSRPSLGIQFHKPSSDQASAYGLKETRGVVIAAFYPESTAKEAGVELGDLVVAIHGHLIRDINQIVNAVAAANIGDVLPLTVIRDGSERTIQVLLGKSSLLKLPQCSSLSTLPPVVTSEILEAIYGKSLSTMNLSELGQIEGEKIRCNTNDADMMNKLTQVGRLAEQAIDEERKRLKAILDSNKAVISSRIERERKITQCRTDRC